MKTLIPLIVTIAVGCASHAQPRLTQPVPPPPPDGDLVIVAQAPAPKASKALPAPAVAPLPPGEPGFSDLVRAQADAVRAHADAVRAHADMAWNMPFKLGSGSSSRRTLVIPKGDANPELLANAEEDLNVMTLILEKAVDTRSEDEGKKALGIDIFSSSSGIRNLLIEGHGVIFTVKTKIALVPPPTPKKEETKTKDTTSSEWDEARRQLYGPSEIEKGIHKAFDKVQMNFNANEEYDEKKVQRLKDSLIEALKSASNIRHLSGDQTVTIVVLSSSSIQEVRKIVTAEPGGGGFGVSGGRGGGRGVGGVYVKADNREISDGRGGSRLMLQAKKSDIDSYAKGKLTTDAFRDKVKIQIY
jgi:predicted DNA binding CopG/RHH family protein